MTVVAASPELRTQSYHVMSFVPWGMSGATLEEGFQTEYAKKFRL